MRWYIGWAKFISIPSPLSHEKKEIPHRIECNIFAISSRPYLCVNWVAIGLRNWEQDPRTFTCLTCSCVRARASWACMQGRYAFRWLIIFIGNGDKAISHSKAPSIGDFPGCLGYTIIHGSIKSQFGPQMWVPFSNDNNSFSIVNILLFLSHV